MTARFFVIFWLIVCLPALVINDSLQIWNTVYCQPGFSNICGDRFEASTAGEYHVVEDDGLQIRNAKYGASCVRTCKPINDKSKERLHYLELELRGGLAPDPSSPLGFYSPEDKWIPIEGARPADCSIEMQILTHSHSNYSSS